MATRQLLSLRSFIPDSLGDPARTAFVHILEPGTTTAVTSFKDGALQIANVNPVPLSASGKASIWVSRDIDVLITLGPLLTDPVLVDEKNANPDVAGGTSSGLVPNGSFENDTDANDVPDGWVEVTEIGSNNGIDTSVSSDGLQSFRFTSVGTGGGSLTTTDFFVVNDVDDLRVSFDLFSSVVDVRNIVRVEWYDISQVPISNTDVYDNAVSNPLVFTPQALVATPPALARFAKLRLIGCDPSDVTPGSTFYDRVNVFYPLVVAGVFDNLTIQNNEIISTNTDGRIQLRPNGNGGVDITSDDAVDLVDINNPLNVGNLDDPTTNPHIAMDATQIQAKADATNTAELLLQPLGGAFSIGDGSAAATLEVGLNAAAGETTRINFQENSVVQTRLIWNAAANRFSVRVVTAGEAFTIEEGNAVNVSAEFTPNGAVVLRNANVIRLSTSSDGIDVVGTNLDLAPGANSTARIRAFNTIGGVSLAVLATTGQAGLFQTDSAGATEDTWVVLTRNGGVALRNNNVERLAVNTTGYQATGTLFDHVNTANTLTQHQVRNSTGGVQISILVGGGVEISQTDSAGVVEDQWIELARNGAVTFNFNDANVARTAAASSGGLEANNTSTGAGFERVLTTSDLPMGAVKAAAQNVVNSTTLVDATDLSVPLQPSAEYILEATLVFAGNGATANGFRWGLDFNGQVGNLDTLFGGSFSWQNSNGAESIIDAAAGGTSQIKTTFDAAGVRETVKISLGIITQSDYVADTNVDIQFAQGTSNGTNTTLDEGSTLKVTRVA